MHGRTTLTIVVLIAVCSLTLVRVGPASADQGRRPDDRHLPLCAGGPNRGPTLPPGPPSADVPQCIAHPTVVTKHPLGRKRLAAPIPTPGYHHSAVSTASYSYFGAYGALQVQDPDLSTAGDAFASAWFLMHFYGEFNQVGWSENTWTGDRRHVFTYQTVDNL